MRDHAGLMPAQEAAEARLGELRRERAATAAALEVAERDLVPAEAALHEAQALYDEAARDLITCQAAQGRPAHGMYDMWSERSGADEARLGETAEEAAAVFEQARSELGQALVRQSALDRRRGELRMQGRRLEAHIEAAEQELAAARAKAERDRGLLDKLKARVAGAVAGTG